MRRLDRGVFQPGLLDPGAKALLGLADLRAKLPRVGADVLIVVRWRALRLDRRELLVLNVGHRLSLSLVARLAVALHGSGPGAAPGQDPQKARHGPAADSSSARYELLIPAQDFSGNLALR